MDSMDVCQKCKDYYRTKTIRKLSFELNATREQFRAVLYTGHEDCLNSLIKSGADVNQHCFEKNFTPLLYATETASPAKVAMLISAGADVNVTCDRGLTPLMYAASFGVPSKMNMMIHAGADVNQKSNNDQTALALATINGYVKSMETLIKAGADVNRCVKVSDTSFYYSPLNIALQARKNPKVCAELLVNAGANIPGYQQARDYKCKLMHLCRQSIRKHLLDIDPHTHLFGRVPRLGLPQLLTDYVLYDKRLDY